MVVRSCPGVGSGKEGIETRFGAGVTSAGGGGGGKVGNGHAALRNPDLALTQLSARDGCTASAKDCIGHHTIPVPHNGPTTH